VDASVERARRCAVWIIVLGTATGAVLIALGRRVLPKISAAQAPLVLAAVGALAVLPLLVLAVYLWRLGARALRTAQFPPPGTATIRAAPPLVGVAARRRARLAQAFAVLLGACALALGIVLWRLSQLLAAR
jgi:hypothetical protein